MSGNTWRRTLGVFGVRCLRCRSMDSNALRLWVNKCSAVRCGAAGICVRCCVYFACGCAQMVGTFLFNLLYELLLLTSTWMHLAIRHRHRKYVPYRGAHEYFLQRRFLLPRINDINPNNYFANALKIQCCPHAYMCIAMRTCMHLVRRSFFFFINRSFALQFCMQAIIEF